MTDSTPDPTPAKQCNKCGEWKPATTEFFHKSKGCSFDLWNICKTCRSTRKPARYIEPGYKHCSSCHQDKPATTEYFAIHNKAKDGLRGFCKACVRARYSDSEKKAEYDRRYREENRPRILASKKLYYESNKESIGQRRKQWQEVNRDTLSEKRKRVFQKNYANPEWRAKLFARGKNWIRANPEKARTMWRKSIRRRVEREHSAPGHHTEKDIKHQYEAQRGKCYYCGCDLGGTYHTDHVIPLVRGGSNGMENIVVACPACNMAKGSKLPTEWDGSNRLL